MENFWVQDSSGAEDNFKYGGAGNQDLETLDYVIDYIISELMFAWKGCVKYIANYTYFAKFYKKI